MEIKKRSKNRVKMKNQLDITSHKIINNKLSYIGLVIYLYVYMNMTITYTLRDTLTHKVPSTYSPLA